MRERLNRNSGVLALLALCLAFVAAVGGVASATGVFVTSKQIRNGTILSQDIHKGGVRSSDVQTGAIQSSDIGNGDVTPVDVTMPDPSQILEGDTASVKVGATFGLIDPVGSYVKEDPASLLEVTWTGTAGTEFGPCVFQLRVDGVPAPNGAGQVYVWGTESVSGTALFSDLAAGSHSIEVWGRAISGGDQPSIACTVGPAEAGIGQTFVVAEQVI